MVIVEYILPKKTRDFNVNFIALVGITLDKQGVCLNYLPSFIDSNLVTNYFFSTPPRSGSSPHCYNTSQQYPLNLLFWILFL